MPGHISYSDINPPKSSSLYFLELRISYPNPCMPVYGTRRNQF